MIWHRTEFFVTVTEGLSAEVLVKAERFGATGGASKARMPEVERPKALQGRKANRAFIKRQV